MSSVTLPREKIIWSDRDSWEKDQMCQSGGPPAIPQVSNQIKDYATDQELEAVRVVLRKLRGHLNRNGTKIERQTIYWVCEAIKDGLLPDVGPWPSLDLEPILYVLPPQLLDILNRYEALAARIDVARQYCTSDEAWEQERRRRRHLEDIMLGKPL
jgi:hypothetical protein